MSEIEEKALRALLTDPATGELYPASVVRWAGIRLVLVLACAVTMVVMALGVGQ